ncbi:transmembrane protein 87A-like [Saccostrea echinata]|uniref:transmembrane protein 87A-like n=1 Tax=Saccostrea echinata TaxID=191078 RepID=UPI002A8129C2|nr:transmembrane protein 87A-like [Saccostrea echinata]
MLNLLTVALCVSGVISISEPGIWRVKYDKEKIIYAFHKSMYKGTNIAVKVDCQQAAKSKGKTMLTIEWVLRYSPCAEEFTGVEDDVSRQMVYLNSPEAQQIQSNPYTKVEYMKNRTTHDCESTFFWLPFQPSKQETVDAYVQPQNATKTEKAKSEKKSKRGAISNAVKAQPSKSTVSPTTKAAAVTTAAPPPPPGEKDRPAFQRTWRDGYFVFVMRITNSETAFHAEVDVEMYGEYGFISAVDMPLLIFYGVMGIVYIIFGLMWLVLLACSWKDLLRIQFWIGGVIVLGMLEKAVFYAEYLSITTQGHSVRGAVIFAELVSCLKRALARILIIIVSLGFGIVKPRLGTTFHKVVAMGTVFFILASIEGCMRQLKPKEDNSTDTMLALVPLAVTDASICWWIFSSLIQTTRTLRLRRNVVKLSLYRHFTNTLIFAVLASIAFMIWSFTQYRLKTCITDWREIWVDEAFWHLLFSVILCVIMVLWRPSANNQRYAFSPLLDAADEEEEENLMNDAFDGMKMRGVKGAANGSPKSRKSVDEDLKWVEENIPTSLTDKALPSLLDSDEEMMTTRYEVNKMQ